MRKANGARVAVDRLAFSLEVAQGVHERVVRTRRGLLALGDVAGGAAALVATPTGAGGLRRSEVCSRWASIQSCVASTPRRTAASRDSTAASSASVTFDSISATRANALARPRCPVASELRIVRSSTYESKLRAPATRSAKAAAPSARRK